MIIPEKDRKRQTYAEIEKMFDGRCAFLIEIDGSSAETKSAVVAVVGDHIDEIIDEGEQMTDIDHDRTKYASFKPFGNIGVAWQEVLE